ncbi:hypothetical protein GQX74_000388 [Glossina fuscipes]|nr:hypothetical protein GQX74_000388 [Glossina fuscipes]
MMSSEEDTDCYGLFTDDDKSLLKPLLSKNPANSSALQSSQSLKTDSEIQHTRPQINNNDQQQIQKQQQQQQQQQQRQQEKEGENSSDYKKVEKNSSIHDVNENHHNNNNKNHHDDDDENAGDDDDEVQFLIGPSNNNNTISHNISCGSLQTSSNISKQQVVTDDERATESSQCGAVNKTTTSSSCASSKYINNNNNNSNNNIKTNIACSSLKISPSSTRLSSNSPRNVQKTEKLLNQNHSDYLTTTATTIITTTPTTATTITFPEEELQKSDTVIDLFNSIPQTTTFINQTTNNSPASVPSPPLLTPSTAAALMSSAAAAAAGAAGGTLYGALLNQSAANSAQSSSQSKTNNIGNHQQSPTGTGSASSSPTASLLTGQFTAALGNLFSANGFSSAKMLNELFGRQMKQAQDATSGLPTTLDNAMLAAAMESATNADLLSAAGLVNSLGLNATNKLLNNNTITNHNAEHQQSTQSSPKNRRTSNCSERSVDDNGSRTGDLTTTPPRTPSVGVNSTSGVTPSSPNLQQQQNDLAHHMLRNILQGKKELLQLDQELRSVINQQQQQQQQQQLKDSAQDSLKHNNNNTNAANNNNNNNNNNVTSDNKNDNNPNVINLIDDTMSDIKIKSEPNSTNMDILNGERRKSQDSEVNGSQHEEEQRSETDQLDQQDNEAQDSERLDLPAAVTKKEAEDILEDVELMGLNSRSDLESLASPSHSDMMLLDNSKDGLEDDLDKESISTVSKKPDMKRARVENIVSSMRSSPSSNLPHMQVNGCKKRKLYQPQQHAMERYVAAAAGLNFGLNLQSIILNDDGDSDDIESPQLQQKRDEKNALKSQLRSMQEQLAEMQQKYVQLCSRMEQESECQEIDDTGSDSMEQDDNGAELSPSPSLTGESGIQEKTSQDSERINLTSPNIPTLKNGKHVNNQNAGMNLENAPNMLSQMMSKMMSASKLHNPLVAHPHMQQSFNGPLPLLQHMPQLQTGDGLADVLKSEITTSLSALVDTIVTRFVHQRRLFSKQSESVAAAAEQLNKDLLLASQILDRKSPRTKVADRSNNNNSSNNNNTNNTASAQSAQVGVAVNQAGNNGSLLLVNTNSNNATTNLNNPNQNMSNSTQLGHLQATVSNGPQMHTGGVTVNVPQHPLNSQTNNQVNSTPNMAATLNVQNCQNLIAAPRLNGSQLSFPSPAAAAAAAMGLQMHHAAAAAAMSAAAAASSQQNLNQHHQNNVVDVGGNAPSNINAMTNANSTNLNSTNANTNNNNSLSTINIPPPHIRPSPTAAAMFQAPKTPQGMNPVAAAALYNSMAVGGPNQLNPFCMPEPRDQKPLQQQQQQQLEQNEALSLVVTPKKKRHKVTDTRITPRTVSRILAQDGMVPPNTAGAVGPTGLAPNGQQMQTNQNQVLCNNNNNNNNNMSNGNNAMNPAALSNNMNTINSMNNMNSMSNNNCIPQVSNGNSQNVNTTPAQSPSPRSQAPAFHPAPQPPPPPMLPVSLPTSVAIPNPSLHESQVFSPYSPFFNPHPTHAPPPPPPPHAGSHTGQHVPPSAAQMHHMKLSASPPGSLGSLMDTRDGSPPLPPHPPAMLHPALLAAAHHSSSPDYSAHLRAAIDAQDRNSDCNSADMQFDGMQPTISFLKQQMM